MSHEAEKESITLTEEEKEAAGRLYNEARNALRELTKLAAKALERTGVRPKAVSRAEVLKEEPIRSCDENGICYCITRDANGQPHIRLC
jgi:hypothetical protein